MEILAQALPERKDLLADILRLSEMLALGRELGMGFLVAHLPDQPCLAFVTGVWSRYHAATCRWKPAGDKLPAKGTLVQLSKPGDEAGTETLHCWVDWPPNGYNQYHVLLEAPKADR